MNIISLLLYHRHYWGIPHDRETDNRPIQTCYECGAEREIKIDLHPFWIPKDQEPTEAGNRAA